MAGGTGRGRGWRGAWVAACLALAGCASVPPAPPATVDVVLGGVAFSSLQWQVKLDALPHGVTPVILHDALQGSLDALEAVLSTWREDSEVSRFNRMPVGQCLTVSPVLLQAVETAAGVSELSGGAYDVTVGPLVDLWGFGPAAVAGDVPDAAAVAAARARVGWR